MSEEQHDDLDFTKPDPFPPKTRILPGLDAICPSCDGEKVGWRRFHADVLCDQCAEREAQT